MTTTIIFLSALCGICLMLGWKIFEIKVHKISFISNLFARGDGVIRQGIDRGIFFYNRYKKISYLFLFEFLPSYAYELIVRLKDYIAKKYYLAGDEIRGRRVLRNSGSVSFFLQRITDERGTELSNVNKV